MAAEVKLTISLSPDTLKELDEEARARKSTRSAVIQEGTKLLRRQRVESLAKGRHPVPGEQVIDYGIGYG
jgi:predicted transcriptional regulator